MSEISRRHVLGAAAAAGSVLAAASDAAAEGQPPWGPTPPVLAGAELPSFRFRLGAVTPKTWDGGWAKEATVVEFPVSQKLAGVLMSLVPGAVRELHWHANAAEWAYMIRGQCRVTTIDPRGHSQIVDFSEFGTFSITDWVGHTPPEVLAKTFGVPASTFANFPKREVYIAKGPVPPPLPADPAPGALNSGALTHRYRLLAQRPQDYPGGTNRLVSQREFPISTTMTGALMRIKPGALREMHWHPNADEWQYYIAGRARMSVFGSHGRVRAEEFAAGDVGYVPQGYGHYIENAGSEDLELLIVLNNGDYQSISLTAWVAANPHLLLATNFKVPEGTFANFPNRERFMPG